MKISQVFKNSNISRTLFVICVIISTTKTNFEQVSRMFPVQELPSYGPYYNWNEDPFRIFNQNFGAGLEDHHLPSTSTMRPPNWAQALLHHHRPRRPTHTAKESGFSEVLCSKDKFEVKLDVHQFAPEEISIKTVDFHVIVEGRHEEKEDPHGFISRNFQRRYLLPDDVKMEHVICELSSDGVLIITVPRVEAIKDNRERFLAITQTGKPALVHAPERRHANANINGDKMHVKFDPKMNVNGEQNGDMMNDTFVCEKKGCNHNGTCEKKA